MDASIIFIIVYLAIAVRVAMILSKDDEWSDNAVIFLAIFWPLVVVLIMVVYILFMIQALIHFIEKKFKRKGG